MKHNEFIAEVTHIIQVYLNNADSFDSNPQLRVNPATLRATVVNGSDMLAELELNDENVESAAAAEGLASQDDDDFQASRNADFYAVSRLIRENGGKPAPNLEAIIEMTETYP